MSKTNFDKLVRWDADYYKSLTDDDCIVCLTEREVYIIGQITDMLRWKRTRWIGDILGLDFDLIASNLEYKLAERMTCQNVTTLLQKINQLESKIDYIFNETVINEGDENTIANYETPASEHLTPQEMADNFSVSADTCDNDGKDALYAGVKQLVYYINQVNIDALENLGQSGNLGEQASKLISAGTGGLTPLDEAVDYTSFLMDELLDEYEATVDEALLNQVTCDLFCIAVANNCTLSMYDVSNYYGHKLPGNALDFTSSLANIIQFAATGTMSGDDYFYFMSVFQLIAVALTDNFFDLHGYDSYKLQILAGMNSPDADWMLLCDECPLLYRSMTYDFQYGELGWETRTEGIASTKGEFIGNRWRGTLTQFNELNIEIVHDADPSWRFHAVKMWVRIENGDTSAYTQVYLLRDSASDTSFVNTNGITDGDYIECNDSLTVAGYHTAVDQMLLIANVDDGDGANVYIDKVQFLFQMNYAPIEASITDDLNICD